MTSSPTTPAPAPPPSAASGDPLRRTVFYSLLAGVTQLIPLPWVDDQVLGWVRSRMIRTHARQVGLEVGDRALAAILGKERFDAVGGCVGFVVGLPFRFVYYLLKKIFKKLILIFTLKDCVDTFSSTFHEGYLLSSAFGQGRVDAAALAPGADPDAARRLRSTVVETLDEIDPRPVRRLVSGTLRGSRRLLVRGARQLVTLHRQLRRRLRRSSSKQDVAEDPAVAAKVKEAEEAEAGLLGGLVDHLTAALSLETEHLRRLDEVFDRRWRERDSKGS